MPDPPVTITPNTASDLPPDTTMLPSRGASDAPIPDDAMLPPTHQAEPQPPQQPSQLSQYDPSLMEPPPAEEHLSALGNILGKVAGLIVGNDKWTVTRDADGNMRAEKQPMSTGEKWGRIAAAALGGAARGMAAGQGPGGAGKAVAAGYQGGFEQQQQAKESAFSEADQQNRELLFKANRASLLQDVVRKTMDNKFTGTKASLDEMSMTNDMLKRLSDAPGSTDAGIYQTPAEVYQIPYKHPELMKGHTDGVVEAYPVYNSDHTIQGFRAYIVDKAWADQKTKEDRYFYNWKPNPDDPVNGKPILEKRLVKAGQTTEGAYAQGMLSTVAQGLNYQKLEADTAKANRPPTPKTYQEAQAAADLETNPTRKAQLQKAADDIKSGEIEIKKKSARAPKGQGETGATGGAPGAALPQETDAYLQTLSPGDRATVKQIGEVRGAPPNRFTKEGKRIMDMVNLAYPQYDSSQFPTYQKTKQAFITGKEGTGLSFINTARNHIARMEQNVDALDNVDIPVVGSFLNAAKNAALKGTNPKLKQFMVDQKAVTNEIARAYQGGAITQGERDQMNHLISSSDSPDVIRAALTEFKNLLSGKVDAYQQQWDQGMPRGQRNAMLDRLSNGGFRPMNQGAEQPAAPNAGQITVNDPTGKPHTFNTQAEADRFKQMAGIK